MDTTLTIDDPLAGQEATIVITLAASSRPRDERPSLVSVGVAEQLPVIKTGVFGNVAALINEAWTAFGVRAQAATAMTESDLIIEEQVVATASTDDEPAATPQPVLSAPKPPAQNLSLF